jgi:cation-transporting P-type ATPase C
MDVGGTDVAVETADVALAGDDLRALLVLRDLGRRSIGLVRQNYGMSIAVNAAGLLISAGGALSPVVAAILHNASSVARATGRSTLIMWFSVERSRVVLRSSWPRRRSRSGRCAGAGQWSRWTA